MKKTMIEIPDLVSAYVEKCFNEWQTVLEVLHYITCRHSLDEHIEYYTKLAEEKHLILETAKNDVAKEYIPKDLLEKNVIYTFNFQENCIEIKERDNE